MRKISEAMVQILLFLLIIVFIVITLVASGVAAPIGVGIDSNVSETRSAPTAANSTAEGGTITTVSLNVSQQSTTWKGYVGNITGQLALQDSDNFTLYDWSFSAFTGEVYASRASNPDWDLINCTNVSIMEAEDSTLGIPITNIDTINATFSGSGHQTFTVGSVPILNSTCPSIVTHINSTAQTLNESAYFQEIALDDDTNIVYTTILEQDQTGFDNEQYDFQLIIPDSYSEATITTYYFFAELV